MKRESARPTRPTRLVEDAAEGNRKKPRRGAILGEDDEDKENIRPWVSFSATLQVIHI